MGGPDSSIYTSMDTTGPIKETAWFRPCVIPQVEVRMVVLVYVCIIIFLSLPLSVYLFVCLFFVSIPVSLSFTHRVFHMNSLLLINKCIYSLL